MIIDTVSLPDQHVVGIVTLTEQHLIEHETQANTKLAHSFVNGVWSYQSTVFPYLSGDLND
ncbi:MAG: hypothetical protein AB8B64_19255 [Granulosicoccus sp.]